MSQAVEHLVEHLWLPQECDACIMVAKYFKDRGPVDGSAKLITKENAFALEKVLQVWCITLQILK